MSTIVNAFITHITSGAPLEVTRDQRFALKQAEVGEIRARRISAEAESVARAKSVSVCKRIVTDIFTDEIEDANIIDEAMEVLARAWGQPIEKTVVPKHVAAANASLNFWRKQL
jgi:hypothetical protein